MIREVSETIADLIESSAPELAPWVSHVGLESDSNTLPNDGLVLSLYSIEENGHMRNRPPELDGEHFRRAAMSMRLSYLVFFNGAATPTQHLETQSRLDRVAQIFHTNPILGPAILAPSLIGVIDRLAVRLWSPTAEERNQIWTAFGRPMRLALYYLVETVPIVPTQADGSTPITTETIEYGVEAGLS